MNMYVAGILVLSVLTNPCIAAVPFPAQLLPLMGQSQPQPDAPQAASPQEPAQKAQPTSPAQEAPKANQETGSQKPGSEKPGSEQTLPPQATPEPNTTEQPQKAQSEASAKKPGSKTKTATRKHRHQKHAAAATSNSVPEKKVVRNGGTADPLVQLAPGVSDEQAWRQRQSTTQLLATTDDKLKQLAARQLSLTQQDSVSQIRKYMEQARAAEDAGDVQRAHNLASKALLLSDDLVKH